MKKLSCRTISSLDTLTLRGSSTFPSHVPGARNVGARAWRQFTKKGARCFLRNVFIWTLNYKRIVSYVGRRGGIPSRLILRWPPPPTSHQPFVQGRCPLLPVKAWSRAAEGNGERATKRYHAVRRFTYRVASARIIRWLQILRTDLLPGDRASVSTNLRRIRLPELPSVKFSSNTVAFILRFYLPNSLILRSSDDRNAQEFYREYE